MSTAALAVQRPLWLVGADLCVFTRLNLARVPPRHRARAIAQQARQLAPFADAAWHAAEDANGAVLWCWDAARVRKAMAEEGNADGNWTVVPEQVFFTPQPDACLRRSGGVQVLERWRDGRLVFSARFAGDERERALLLRSAGLAVDAQLPERDGRPGSERWDQRPPDWGRLARDPRALGAAALLAASLYLCWSLGELFGLDFANARLQAKLEAQQLQLAPLLARRDEALSLTNRRLALQSLLEGPGALDLAAEFEHLVGSRYQQLLDWQFGAGRLRVVLQDANADNRAYVEALERSPWFETVSISPALRADQLNLELTLVDSEQPPLYLRDQQGEAQ